MIKPAQRCAEYRGVRRLFCRIRFFQYLLRSELMLMKEGETRIPAGCAISGFINRSGRRTNGSVIVNSIACMHDRSNGLGGGYAGYGIYPEYKDQYAFHVFYDSNEARIRPRRSSTVISTSSTSRVFPPESTRTSPTSRLSGATSLTLFPQSSRRASSTSAPTLPAASSR